MRTFFQCCLTLFMSTLKYTTLFQCWFDVVPHCPKQRWNVCWVIVIIVLLSYSDHTILLLIDLLMLFWLYWYNQNNLVWSMEKNDLLEKKIMISFSYSIQIHNMDLFPKSYLLWRKALIKLFGRALNTRLEHAHFGYIV